MVRNSSTALSEQEMDDYTIRVVRDELAAESQTPRPLVYVCVTDTLARVVETIVRARCHTIPVLTCPLGDDDGARDESSVPEVVHSASLAGVLACLLRHFRASAPSLPLLSRPLRQLPVGTWDARGSLAAQNDGRRVVDLACVEPTAPLSTALRLLVETGVSCLPVVDDARTLLDVYARADICMLAKGNAYSRLQAEDVTVGQALTLASAPLGAPAAGGGWGAAGAAGAGGAKQRVWICTADDTLRTIVERLAVPGVRRLVVVEASTHRVEGIVSLSDVAAFLMQPLG